MKRIFFSIAFIASIAMSSFAQTSPIVGTSNLPVDEDTKLITYKEVVKETGTVDELYIRALAWINKTFPNPTDVTQIRDRANGKLEGIARFKIHKTLPDGSKVDHGVISYTFTIEGKEGRYRYTFTKFNLKSMSYYPLERWLDNKSTYIDGYTNANLLQVDEKIKELIESLKESMKFKAKKDDSW
ncbi:MAG: DUF4468 domain-containing protein [Bacteroidota bacterium]